MAHASASPRAPTTLAPQRRFSSNRNSWAGAPDAPKSANEHRNYHRKKLTQSRLLPSLLLNCLASVLLAQEASAGIIPSFNLNSSLEKATHILLASEGENIDGRLLVLESWKGNLHPGDAIDVPELAQFAPRESRTLKEFGTDREYGTVTGDRMILFLVKSLDWAKPGSDELKTKWLPASFPDYIPEGTGHKGPLDNDARMRISVCWVEGEKTYAYAQVENPGPLLLVDWGWGDAQSVHKRVNDWRDTQNALRSIDAVYDPGERVNRAIDFGREHPDWMADAVEIVAGAGDAAIPALEGMLNNPANKQVHGLIVRDIGDVGGVDAGPTLTDILKRELAFWRNEAPNIEKGWWNHDPGDRRELLRDRYEVAAKTLPALEDLGYPACKDAVVEFRDFWESQPQLNDVGEMSETCDRILNSFEHPRKAKIKHAWGFAFAASDPDPVHRAEGLVRIVDVGDFRTRQRAFNAMSECGVPALPYLRAMLNNDECTGDRTCVIRNFAKAGGNRVGGEIAQFISRETAFLKKNDLVGTAKEWNQLSPVARCHYGTLEAAIVSLDEMEYTGAVKEVGELLAILDAPDASDLSKWLPVTRACEGYVERHR